MMSLESWPNVKDCNKGGYLYSLLFICPLSFPPRHPLSVTEDIQYFLFPRVHPTWAPGPWRIGSGLPCSQSLYSLCVRKFYSQMIYFKQWNTAITTIFGLAYQLEEISMKKTISQGRLSGSRIRRYVITGLWVPSFQKALQKLTNPITSLKRNTN